MFKTNAAWKTIRTQWAFQRREVAAEKEKVCSLWQSSSTSISSSKLFKKHSPRIVKALKTKRDHSERLRIGGYTRAKEKSEKSLPKIWITLYMWKIIYGVVRPEQQDFYLKWNAIKTTLVVRLLWTTEWQVHII